MKESMRPCYREEDLFPRNFALCEEKPYGLLFCDPENRDSFDSNHAVIFKDRITDLGAVLKDIVSFYEEKGCHPVIYQSMLDEAWFDDEKEAFSGAGFDIWNEQQRYMLLTEENRIIPNPEITVKRIREWDASLEQIFLEAEEPWEIPVARKSSAYAGEWMFAAYIGENPAGILYSHQCGDVCRVDYMLVSKLHRGTGAGRTLVYHFAEQIRNAGVGNVFLWPDGDTPERIYYEGGFRVAETRTAGRAAYSSDRPAE
ncbi:MAG: hypothetical protein CW338_04390 [Clostridiales bacterium]|nr:hypothetical protein [Clostridiales bacterium]